MPIYREVLCVLCLFSPKVAPCRTTVCVCAPLCPTFVTSWATACQAPLSMGFSRQEYWNGLPFPSPGDLPDPGIEPGSLASLALAGGFFTVEPPGKPMDQYQNQANDIGTIHRAYSDFISLPSMCVFFCVCVCVCV